MAEQTCTITDRDRLVRLLARLSNAHGVSGHEGEIRAIVREELEGFVDDLYEDRMGNLIAVRRGDDFRIMLASHMDEIGFMVKYVEKEGFLRFAPIGGWFPPMLAGQRAVLHGSKGPVLGVLGSKPVHVMDDEERKKPLKIEEMFIDVGAESADAVTALGIRPGTPVTIDREFCSLCGDRVSGKAFDNRAGVALLIEVLRQARSPSTVYGVFTVQEEVGLKGARVSAYALDPDCAVATDVTIPGDHPGVQLKDAPVEMGKGPVVSIADANGRGLIAHPAMLGWIRETAEACAIPVQFEVGSGGTTDASSIHLSREGIPSTVLSTPARYIHTPVEVIDLRDLEAGIRLLVTALRTRPDIPPRRSGGSA
jgi:putative aminopeptidase FrvX